MTQSNLVSNSIAFDFSKPAPACDLPLGWLDTEMEWTGMSQDDTRALMLMAAVFTNPEVKTDDHTYLCSEETLAVRLLALIAAGAPVRLHPKDAADLKALARKLADQVGGELAENIRYVISRYDERSQQAARDGNHNVELELLDGRGYRDLGEGIPAQWFITATPRQHLLLKAALYCAAKPRLCNRRAEALVLLALYGAGCGFVLDKHQFNRLTKAVQTYRSQMKAPHFAHTANLQFANYVLRHAMRRFRRETDGSRG